MTCACKCCCGCCCTGSVGEQTLEAACVSPDVYHGKGSECGVCCDLGAVREDITTEAECPGTWVEHGKCLESPCASCSGCVRYPLVIGYYPNWTYGLVAEQPTGCSPCCQTLDIAFSYTPVEGSSESKTVGIPLGLYGGVGQWTSVTTCADGVLTITLSHQGDGVSTQVLSLTVPLLASGCAEDGTVEDVTLVSDTHETGFTATATISTGPRTLEGPAYLCIPGCCCKDGQGTSKSYEECDGTWHAGECEPYQCECTCSEYKAICTETVLLTDEVGAQGPCPPRFDRPVVSPPSGTIYVVATDLSTDAMWACKKDGQFLHVASYPGDPKGGQPVHAGCSSYWWWWPPPEPCGVTTPGTESVVHYLYYQRERVVNDCSECVSSPTVYCDVTMEDGSVVQREVPRKAGHVVSTCSPAGACSSVRPCIGAGVARCANVSALSYVPLATSGPGTELKKLLKKIGITTSPGCACNQRARTMDEKGCDWCVENLSTIVGWLKEEHARQKVLIPFSETVVSLLVRYAIRRARAIAK